jgi:hypothetical protein
MSHYWIYYVGEIAEGVVDARATKDAFWASVRRHPALVELNVTADGTGAQPNPMVKSDLYGKGCVFVFSAVVKQKRVADFIANKMPRGSTVLDILDLIIAPISAPLASAVKGWQLILAETQADMLVAAKAELADYYATIAQQRIDLGLE